MSGYFYRGRHRAPTPAGRATARVAVVGAVVAGTPFGLVEAAQAEPPGGWGPIVACESGGNPTVRNRVGTAAGLYQFLTTSWLAYGGGKYAATADRATVAQQTEIANVAYARSGLTPWTASRSCWGGKVGSGPPAPAIKAVPKRTPQSQAAKPQPPAAKPAKRAPVAQSAAQPVTDGSYTVVSGDTLSGIAARRGGSWQALWERNKAAIPNADLIFPGQRLAL